MSFNSWALFEDDEARKAILDLRKTLASTQLDLQNQIEKLKADNAQLRGQLEALQKQGEDLTHNQKTYYQDLDSRLGNFEPHSIEIEGLSGIVQPNEKKSYDDALKSFQSNQLKKANEEFAAFIRKYNDSPYLPLAMYWLANTKSVMKDYPGAIAQVQALIKRFPNHQRIPAAMITLGNAQLESGNKTAARKTFGDVIAKYPESDAAKDAAILLPATK